MEQGQCQGLGTWLKILRVPVSNSPQSFLWNHLRNDGGFRAWQSCGRNAFQLYGSAFHFPNNFSFPRFDHKSYVLYSVSVMLVSSIGCGHCKWLGRKSPLATMLLSATCWGIVQPPVCCQVSQPAWSTCQIRWITLQQCAVQIPFRRHGAAGKKRHRGWGFYECNLSLSHYVCCFHAICGSYKEGFS